VSGQERRDPVGWTLLEFALAATPLELVLQREPARARRLKLPGNANHHVILIITRQKFVLMSEDRIP